MRRSTAWLLCLALTMCPAAAMAEAKNGGAGDSSGWLWLDDPLGVEAEAGLGDAASPQFPCDAALPEDKPLDLADVARRVLCKNPAARQSAHEAMAQAARLGSSRAAWFPRVTGSVGVDETYTSVDGARSGNGWAAAASPSVALDYLLFDFGARQASVDSAKAALSASGSARAATIQSLVFSAAQSFYRACSTQAAVAAEEETLNAAKASMEAAAMRYSVGSASLADKLQAETAHAQSALALRQSRNDYEVAKGGLASLMGLSPDAKIKVSVGSPPELPARMTDDVAAILEGAKKSRPDLAAAAAQVDKAAAEVAVQRANGLPKLSLGGSYGRSLPISGGSIDRESGAIGVTLSVPIFTGFDRDYQVRAAKENLKSQTAQREAAENDALLDVWKSYNGYLTAAETVDMTASLLKSAGQSAEVALGRYKAGAGSITDLLSTQAQLADARRQDVQARFNWLTARADLLRSTGKLEAGNYGAAGKP